MDDIIDKDELADGFQIKDGADDADVVDTDEVLDDPNTELYDKAFAKADPLVEEHPENEDAEEMYNLIFQEQGYDEL